MVIYSLFYYVFLVLRINLVKIYNARNHIYAENFKLKLCMCAQSIDLVICTPISAWNYQMKYHFWNTKGRVRIRKSKSGEKWNIQLVNDVHGVILYRCCTSKLCSYKCQILHNGCPLKRERRVSYAFLPKLTHFKDLKCIFQYQRTPALVNLFQHINKDGDLCY